MQWWRHGRGTYPRCKSQEIKRGHHRFVMYVPHTLDEKVARMKLADALNGVFYEPPVWTPDTEAMNTGTQHLGRALRPVPEAPAEVRALEASYRHVA